VKRQQLLLSENLSDVHGRYTVGKSVVRVTVCTLSGVASLYVERRAATAVMQSSLCKGFNSVKMENTRGAGTNSIVSHYFPLNSDIVVAPWCRYQ
jgi:hypothetical protein